MPLRPFPSPYRVGIDICAVPRIAKVLFGGGVSQPQDNQSIMGARMRFLDKLFRPEEIRVLREKSISSNMDRNHLTLHVAGRWAAKEAIIKAASPRKIGPKDILIWQPKAPGGPKAAILSALGTEPQSVDLDPNNFTELLDGDMVEISISHDSDYATAMAIYHPAI